MCRRCDLLDTRAAGRCRAAPGRSPVVVARVPMLAGSRVAVVTAPDDDVVLRPPPPGVGLADVGAAVRDALRFPLAGDPLEQLVPRGGRATIVVEPPALPLPAAPSAIPATTRSRRPSTSSRARASRSSGRRSSSRAASPASSAGATWSSSSRPSSHAASTAGVEVHDVESPDLIEVGRAGEIPLRVNPALVDTDVVVVVTAAETVSRRPRRARWCRGGPRRCGAGRARSRCSRPAQRTAGGSASRWSGRLPPGSRSSAPRSSCSHPRFVGALHGYPYDPAALERIVRSPCGGCSARCRGRCG